MVNRLKVLSIFLLHTARLEHFPIKIQIKASIEEEASALLVSTGINGDFSNLQKISKVNTFYKLSKTCELSMKYENESTC